MQNKYYNQQLETEMHKISKKLRLYFKCSINQKNKDGHILNTIIVTIKNAVCFLVNSILTTQTDFAIMVNITTSDSSSTKLSSKVIEVTFNLPLSYLISFIHFAKGKKEILL